MIAVGQGVGKPLEDEQPGPFADHKPSAAGVERVGMSVRAQGAELGETHLSVKRIGPGKTACHDGINSPREQVVGRQFQGVERRGTRGVERVRAAAEPERLREQTRREARGMEIQGIGRFRGIRDRTPGDSLGEGFPQSLAGERRGRLGGEDDVAEDHGDAGLVNAIGLRVGPGRSPGVEGEEEGWIES